jgi:hypothetical protein
MEESDTDMSFVASRYWVSIALVLLALGCNSRPRFEPVEGTVLHKGKAASGVVVTFHLKGGDPVTTVRPVGLTDTEGKFTLTTGHDKGAPEGEYVVTFLWPKEVADKRAKKFDTSSGGDTTDGFDGVYANASNSKYKAEVKRGGSKLDPFRLE